MLALEVWHIVLTAAILLLLGGYIGARVSILASLLQTGQEKEHDVTVLLDRIADEMAKYPIEQWPGWCVHLLRSLEGKAQGGEYRQTLEAIRDRIASRLKTEWW